jgi:hypothetical protein
MPPFVGVILIFMIILCPLFPPLLLAAVDLGERIMKFNR